MVSLRAIPMVRLMIPIVCGILAADIFPSIDSTWLLCGLSMSALLFIFFSQKKVQVGSRSVGFGIVLGLTFFLFGIWLMERSDERNAPDYIGQRLDSTMRLIGTVTAPPKQGAWWKFPLQVSAIQDSAGSISEASGTVLILMDSMLVPEQPLRYGSKILVEAQPQKTQAPKNPHQFDYAAYLHYKNIHHQIFLKKNTPIILGQGEGSWLWNRIYPYREQLLLTLRKHLTSEHSFAVGAAILLGYKDDLSDGIRQTFVETGTMHILAVSGAHVGILYACLAFLLGLLPFYGRKWQIAEPVLLALGIWFFVLLTGAAEPAVRAAIMFSFYLLAKVLRKDHNIYNILALSAFLMLLYEPRQLFTIGFQLSFGAVLGIALFWQPFRRLIPWKMHRYAQEVLNLVALGCAAQLGILPFSMYYFHQLPTFFWLTGTLVIPFATAYLWGSIGLLSLGALHPWIAYAIGWCLDTILWMMNKMLFFFKSLPGHLIEGIWLSAWMTVFSFIALYAFAYAIYSRKKEAVFILTMSLLFVSIARAEHWWAHRQQSKIVVYSVGKSLLIDGFQRSSCVTLQEGIDSKKAAFATKNNRAAHAIQSIDSTRNTVISLYKAPVFAIGEKRIAIVDTDWSLREPLRLQEKIEVDALFFRGKKIKNIERHLELFVPKIMLVDASLSYRNRKRCRALAKEHQLHFKDISAEGAWETLD